MLGRIFLNRLVWIKFLFWLNIKLDVLWNSNENSVKEFNIVMFVYWIYMITAARCSEYSNFSWNVCVRRVYIT